MAEPLIPKASTIRISRDLAELRAMTIDADSPGLFLKYDNLNKFYIMLVGPAGTPYANCPIFLTIQPCANYNHRESTMYPAQSPLVLHYSPYHIRIHPNLYEAAHTGKVCLSILGTWAGPSWTSMMNFSTIIQSIYMILDADPLRNEPGHESKGSKSYALAVEYEMLCTTLKLFKHVAHLGESHKIELSQRFHSGQSDTIDLAMFRDELRWLWLKNKAYYPAALDKFTAETPRSSSIYGNQLRKYAKHNTMLTQLDQIAGQIAPHRIVIQHNLPQDDPIAKQLLAHIHCSASTDLVNLADATIFVLNFANHPPYADTNSTQKIITIDTAGKFEQIIVRIKCQIADLGLPIAFVSS